MPETEEVHLRTLTDLERQLRRRHGRRAEPMLANLPLDYERRVASLRRMLGMDPTTEGAGKSPN